MHAIHPTRSDPAALSRRRMAGRAGLVVGPLLVLGLGLVAAGCGDDDDADDSAPSETTEADNSDNLGPNSEAPATEVIAVDYHFEDLPETIEAGSQLAMHNESTVEVHELVAMAIPEDETRSVEELIALPQPELIAALGGEPALVMIAPPGEDAFPVVGDGTLDAGRYLVACFIPTGADPDEYMQAAQESQDGPPQVAGGPPHSTEGMYAELVLE